MVLGPNGMGSGKSSIVCAIRLARHWSPGAPRASTLAADTGSIEIGIVEGAHGAVGRTAYLAIAIVQHAPR
ncbi:hypothetical protein C8R43DRAFT_1135948 [Mycena crocata]|nr:hypothetical protein C8R43DRAFT_1135948 [Mycena crocata]